jgi:hypothetical protein
MISFTRIAGSRFRNKAIQTDPPQFFSEYSSPAVPNSMWCSTDMLLGAGMVIIQPTTGKIVVLRDSKNGFWFLPKGRKDIGESLEQAAVREAYEEVRESSALLRDLNYET